MDFKNKIPYSYLIKIFFQTFIISLSIFIISLIYLFSLSKTLPSIEELDKFNPEQVSRILSSDNIILKKLFIQKRDMIKIVSVPKHLREALLVMEDREFYKHNGISIKSTVRALLVDLISLSLNLDFFWFLLVVYLRQSILPQLCLSNLFLYSIFLGLNAVLPWI